MGSRWADWYSRYPVVFWGALAVLVVVVVALVRSWTTPARHAAPAPAPASSHLQVVGFYENTQPSSIHSFEAHWRSITTVTPRWFSVDASGAVSNVGYDRRVADFARSHHILLVPLVNNGAGVATMLASPTLRATAARNLAQLVATDHLNGLNIDFELLPPTARDGLTSFFADLRKDMGTGKVLAASVFPLVGLPASVNGFDNYAGIASYANYLVVMTYDHHYSGGPPGAVAPYSWVQDNIAAALKLVPSSKLMLAIGMYGYDWASSAPSPATSLSDIQAEALAKAQGVTPQFDAQNSQNHFTYSTHVVWYMGDRSARARANLARQDHLAGIGLWRLGYEDPRFWSYLNP